MPAADQNIVAGATSDLVVVVITVNPIVARPAMQHVRLRRSDNPVIISIRNSGCKGTLYVLSRPDRSIREHELLDTKTIKLTK